MDYTKTIKHWVKHLGLGGWHIRLEPILPTQVEYADDVPQEDRYFIGVRIEEDIKRATIFYDRPMEEEDVLHELIHVRFPEYTEKQVNEYCDELLS